jgi:hypothetical protein
LSFSGHKTSELLLVLLTGVCLAANASYAAAGSTANGTEKPVSHLAAHTAHPPTTHPAAKKAGTTTAAAHSATPRRATPHAGSGHYAARKATPHYSSVSAAKRTPNHTAALTSQRKGSSSRNRPARSLSGQQRLARLHLQPERVEEIQQALIREGYLQGDASGQWDSRTHDAMQRYQTMHGFPGTGLPEAKSLMKLGLGAHPLPAELDHGPTGVATPTGAQGVFTVSPSSPPISQVTPPS